MTSPQGQVVGRKGRRTDKAAIQAAAGQVNCLEWKCSARLPCGTMEWELNEAAVRHSRRTPRRTRTPGLGLPALCAHGWDKQHGQEKLSQLCSLSPHPQRSGANLTTAAPSSRLPCARRPTARIQTTSMTSMTEILPLALGGKKPAVFSLAQ